MVWKLAFSEASPWVADQSLIHGVVAWFSGTEAMDRQKAQVLSLIHGVESWLFGIEAMDRYNKIWENIDFNSNRLCVRSLLRHRGRVVLEQAFDSESKQNRSKSWSAPCLGTGDRAQTIVRSLLAKGTELSIRF